MSQPDKQRPMPPNFPPEMSDDETQMQTPQDRTRDMPPVKDVRLQPPSQQPQQVQPQPNKPKRGGAQQPRPRNRSPLHIPIWAVALMLVTVCGSVACIAAAVVALGGRTAPTSPPQFLIITAQPSLTMELELPSLLASPTLPAQFQAAGEQVIVLQGPTLAPIIFTATPTPAPRIEIGSSVAVVGSNGIRVRSSPGTDNSINAVLRIAEPGEVFTVVSGPQDANGLTWWRVRDASGLEGWAAETDGVRELLQVVAPA
jgi:hypothetical protein